MSGKNERIGRSKLRAKTVECEERSSELTAPLRDVYRQCSTLPNERDVNTDLEFRLIRQKLKSIGENSKSSSRNPPGAVADPRKGS